jgi:hypothetical protein
VTTTTGEIVKRIALIAGAAVGLYLAGRAIAELFVIDWANPASYRDAWGGPSLAGVLAVHCLPGLVALAAFARWALRRRSARATR